MNPAWSWALTAIGCTGLLIAGRGTWWGWVVNLGGQALWAVYALVTGQHGFLAACVLYSGVYIHNARATRARDRAHHAHTKE